MQHYDFEKEAKESKKKTDQQLDEMLGHESELFPLVGGSRLC